MTQCGSFHPTSIANREHQHLLTAMALPLGIFLGGCVVAIPVVTGYRAGRRAPEEDERRSRQRVTHVEV